jgi:hypothetical protein
MIYFSPPNTHPRFLEKVMVKFDGEWQEGEIYWVYGPEKFFLIGFKDNRYLDGLRFEIYPKTRVKFFE